MYFQVITLFVKSSCPLNQSTPQRFKIYEPLCFIMKVYFSFPVWSALLMVVLIELTVGSILAAAGLSLLRAWTRHVSLSPPVGDGLSASEVFHGSGGGFSGARRGRLGTGVGASVRNRMLAQVRLLYCRLDKTLIDTWELLRKDFPLTPFTGFTHPETRQPSTGMF